jgi:hypothetical protein
MCNRGDVTCCVEIDFGRLLLQDVNFNDLVFEIYTDESYCGVRTIQAEDDGTRSPGMWLFFVHTSIQCNLVPIVDVQHQ